MRQRQPLQKAREIPRARENSSEGHADGTTEQPISNQEVVRKDIWEPGADSGARSPGIAPAAKRGLLPTHRKSYPRQVIPPTGAAGHPRVQSHPPV